MNKMTDLFQKIDFISHSGLPLTWKIECDGISSDEWVALAHIIREYEKRNWQYAIGIPRGGVKLAKELDKYSTNDINDPILIVDDVYTTGRSFRDFSENFVDSEIIKWCVFARKPIQEDVNALFTMP
ncbi:MAG: hypothetical protein VW298_02790 [Candidatus Woesearchaeota archaeon]